MVVVPLGTAGSAVRACGGNSRSFTTRALPSVTRSTGLACAVAGRAASSTPTPKAIRRPLHLIASLRVLQPCGAKVVRRGGQNLDAARWTLDSPHGHGGATADGRGALVPGTLLDHPRAHRAVHDAVR